ncbi:MAG TPA: zinc ribbon domain-containing protein [Solirubrobacteraceae bacterium]|nr:zinc ribbon domain-containing protein [Solirubrobacteraceae bacterium]
MSATDTEQTLEAPALAQPPPAPAYETCEQCESPVDSNQRYCVVCGTHRRHVYDPAARFMAGATSRSRSASRSARTPASGGRRSPGLALALALAVIPLAVAAGVLLGGHGNDANRKLLAALRAQKPTVVNVQGGGGATSGATTASRGGSVGGAATPAAHVTSTFPLQQGYAVELQTLRGSGTTQVKVAAAESHARAHGATSVGVISQADFKVTPAPPAGDFVIYSGQYHSSADATAALAKLKHAFPGAKVIAVGPVGGSTPVLSTTSYGSAHQVSGFKPSASQLASGANEAQRVSKEINGNYVKSQQGLPDSISVP